MTRVLFGYETRYNDIESCQRCGKLGVFEFDPSDGEYTVIRYCVPCLQWMEQTAIVLIAQQKGKTQGVPEGFLFPR